MSLFFFVQLESNGLESFVPAGPWRTMLECAVLLLTVTLMMIWQRHNRVALDLARGRRL